MKKILIPIDFSGHTGITCSYALEFAKNEGAELRLFHSFFDQIVLADSSFPEAIDVSTMYNEELLKEIKNQAERKMEAFRLQLEEEIKTKLIADTIVSVSISGIEIGLELKEVYREFNPDIILVGMKGAGKNLTVWGRVASLIIRNAEVPVMTVPEIQKFLTFKKIMIAAGLKEDVSGLIRKVIELFSPFNAKVLCVHFLSKEKHKDEKEKMNQLREKFSEEEKAGIVSFEMRPVKKDNQEAIDEFVKDCGIGLIAFQPHRHGILFKLFTRKITKKNLFAANVPLLAFPISAKKQVQSS